MVAGVVLANLRTTPKGGRIEVNSAPDISPDRIRLGGLKAVSDPNPPAVREHKDFRKSNQGRTMAPGETIDAQEQVPLDSAGTWKLWPC